MATTLTKEELLQLSKEELAEKCVTYEKDFNEWTEYYRKRIGRLKDVLNAIEIIVINTKDI